jgi:uncharacterized membrane protein
MKTSIGQTLLASILSVGAFFLATALTRDYFMESEAGWALLLWLLSGAFAVMLTLAFCRGALPNHSYQGVIILLLLIFSSLLFFGRRDLGFALLSYGPTVIALIWVWRRVRRKLWEESITESEDFIKTREPHEET